MSFCQIVIIFLKKLMRIQSRTIKLGHKNFISKSAFGAKSETWSRGYKLSISFNHRTDLMSALFSVASGVSLFNEKNN